MGFYGFTVLIESDAPITKADLFSLITASRVVCLSSVTIEEMDLSEPDIGMEDEFDFDLEDEPCSCGK